ncbi:hypothetical protein LTR16_010189, partial [Cryomyces antarcticus]
MHSLALLRRAIYVIQQDGYSDEREFSENLSVDLQTATNVFKHLNEKGFIVSTPSSHKKDSAKRGKL